MMAAVALENAPKNLPTLTLQHRDELVDQNMKKFIKYAGVTNIRRPMTINASSKAWDAAPGGWNFAMVQTVIRNLDDMPRLGMIAIDEAHHVAANTYMRIINKAKQDNPNILIYGTTATPNRGDRKALRMIFDNCGDSITIGELIREGHLVRPRTFVMDLGVNDQLLKIDNKTIDFDEKVEGILNHTVLTDKVIEKWEGFTDPKTGEFVSCKDKQTIIFCQTVQHARDVTDRFVAHGVKAELIEGNMSPKERKAVLDRYDRAETQVLVNVYVLTEGFDNQPTSCVIIFKKESNKSSLTQMIGRGLRKVDPELYPGFIKDSCTVLDFGTSCIIHGSLEDATDLFGKGCKHCPACESEMPQSLKECAICGHVFPAPAQLLKSSVNSLAGSGGDDEEERILNNFVMSEVDILQDSPFKYESFYDGRVMVCFGFSYWAAVVHFEDMRYYAIGAEANDENKTNYRIHILNSSDNYLIALQSADDFMRCKSNKTDAKRVAKWIYEPPTPKQLEILCEGPFNPAMSISMSKYRASCGIQFKFYSKQIQSVIKAYSNAKKGSF